jgi:hypothetical protein
VVAAGILTCARVYRAGDWPLSWWPRHLSSENLSFITYVSLGLLVLSFPSAVYNGWRWYVGAQVERLSNWSNADALSLPKRGLAQPPRQALNVRLYDAPRPRAIRGLGPVDESRNVVGRPPLHLLYLRLFENQPRARTFMQGAWREFGYVYLLRSAMSVTQAEIKRARSAGLAALWVDSTPELSARIEQSLGKPISRGWRTFNDVSAYRIWARDRYGAYPVASLLCGGSYWRTAVDELLNRVDLVLLDLSGFRANEGTGYELQRVIDCFPIERVCFLVDPNSNRKYLIRDVQLAWQRMAAGSPNDSPRQHHVSMAKTDIVETTVTQDAHGNVTNTQTRLKAQRRETRQLALQFQDYIASLPEPGPVPVTPYVDAPPGPLPGLHLWRYKAFSALAAGVLAATVAFVPSLVKPQVSVPELAGLQLAAALRALDNGPLALGQIITKQGNKMNQVQGQDPAAGTLVHRGQEIDLVLSVTSEMVQIPVVSGLHLELASNVLEQLKLKVVIQPETQPTDVELSRVTRTDPDALKKVTKGTRVTIYYAVVGTRSTSPAPSTTKTVTPTGTPTQTPPSGAT